MSDAPREIWVASHLGEYGTYYPEAVEAEGEYGGTAVKYIRADIAEAQRDILKRGVELISGDAVGLEWKQECRAFIKQARAVLAKIQEKDDD